MAIISAQPLVSCIIPTKDRPGLVVRAVKSAFGQLHKNIEVIVIDDSTNDDTRKVLSSSGLQIKYIKNEKSRGACYSRNVGLYEAKGDFIAFLDDDDAWIPEKTTVQLKLLKTHPIAGCNHVTTIDEKRYYIRRPALVSYEDMLYHNYLGSCSFVMVSVDAVRGCFFDESLRACQDWDMWITIMKKNSIKEVANAAEYLVDYNCGMHAKISNAVDIMPIRLSIYEKYTDDHNDYTTQMFCLYNMVPAGNSTVMWMLREFAIAKMKNKGIFFFLKSAAKKLFRYTEFY